MGIWRVGRGIAAKVLTKHHPKAADCTSKLYKGKVSKLSFAELKIPFGCESLGRFLLAESHLFASNVGHDIGQGCLSMKGVEGFSGDPPWNDGMMVETLPCWEYLHPLHPGWSRLSDSRTLPYTHTEVWHVHKDTATGIISTTWCTALILHIHTPSGTICTNKFVIVFRPCFSREVLPQNGTFLNLRIDEFNVKNL